MSKLEEYLSSHELSEIHPSDIAKILKQLNDSEFSKSLKLVPKNLIGEISLALPDRYFDDVVKNLTIDELRDAVTYLESDDQVDFLQWLEDIDKSIALKVFNTLGEEDKKEIIKLQKYNYNEVGAYMQLEIFTADKNEVVHDVIRRFAELRKAKIIKNIQNLFITSNEKKLLFTVGLDDLLIFDFNKTLLENIEQSKDSFEPKIAQGRENIRDVVHYFEEYDLSVMPMEFCLIV